MAERLTIGLSLSLTGKYAPMGRQAEQGLRLFVADTNDAGGATIGQRRYELALRCEDDCSTPAKCSDIYRSLCFENRAELLLGPCSSELARCAAPIAERAGTVMVNHGGADDSLHAGTPRWIISVSSPASEYLQSFVRLLATLKFWRKRLALVASAASGFAAAAANGVERACSERSARRSGVRLRVKYTGRFDPERTPATLFPALVRGRVNALVSAGGFEHDTALMRAVVHSRLNIPVLACVAAGIGHFGDDLGEDAEGIVGPSQWEESANLRPAIGPSPSEFARRMHAAGFGADCDYFAAQAYAAGLLALAAAVEAESLDQSRIRDALRDLRTSTLFGSFAVDPVNGRQVGHRMLLVQWHAGQKVVIDPESAATSGTLELPSGWRLLLSSFQVLKLSRGKGGANQDDSEPSG